MPGVYKAVDAATGKPLWKFSTGSGISQGGISYQVDGKQYIAVVSGRTKGAPAFFGPIGAKAVASSPEGSVVVVVFELPN